MSGRDFGVGAVDQSGCKNSVKEPRPYVVWVSNQLSISPEHFYQVSRPEREQLLHNGLSHSSLIPQWQL